MEEKRDFDHSGSHDTPPGSKHQFIKNDRYFTICIYVFLLVVVSTVAIKAIVSFSDTQKFLGGIFRAVSPFLIAVLIAYVLNPCVNWVNRAMRHLFKRLPAKPGMVLSMLVVYLLALGLLISFLVYILPQVVNNLADLIKYIPKGYEQLLNMVAALEKRFPDVDFTPITNMLQNTQGDVVSSLQDVAGRLIPVLYTASVSIVSWLANFLIAIVVSIYILYGHKSLRRIGKIALYAVVPRNRIPILKEILNDCHTIFGNYVISKMIDSLIIGILCAILMAILRLPYVFLISIVVGITNMIPYFGPFIGAVPGIVIILVSSPVKALIFAVMILCLQQFDGLYLGPKLMGNSTGMKPLWIIFAITIGGKFFGVIGMFLGVPVIAILSYLGDRYMRYRLAKKNLSMEEIY